MLCMSVNRSPLNFYGESKLLAEQAAIAGNPDSTICLRVPVLCVSLSVSGTNVRYGAGKNNESAVNVILDSAMVFRFVFVTE